MTSDRNWRPPRVTTALAAGIVLAVGWLLATAVGVTTVALVAATGGAGLAVVARLAGAARFRPVALAAAVAVTPVAGVFAAAGTGFVVVAQIAGIAPVGTVFVVVGLAVGAFGVGALVARIDRTDVTRAVLPTVVAAAAAVLTALVPVAGAVVSGEGVELPSLPVAPVVRPLLAPPASPPPVGTFLVVVGLAAGAAGGLLTTLPARELLADGTDRRAVETLDRLTAALGWWPVIAVTGVAVGAVTLVVPDAWPDSLAGPVGTVAANRAIRAFAVGLVAVRLLFGGLVRAIRAGYTRESSTTVEALGVPVGWGLVAVGAWTFHGRVIEPLRATVRRVAPPSVAAPFAREADAVIAYYGEPTVALAVLAAGTVLGAVGAVGVAIASGLAVPRGARLGPGGAGGGLFLSGAFGLAAAVPTGRALVAIVGGVVSWEIARHGVSLGREVGRKPSTRGVTLVHAVGAAAVGAVGVGVTRLAGTAAGALTVADATPALVAAAVALVVLLVTLRRL